MIVQVLWVCVMALLAVAVLEIFWPRVLNEGFTTLLSVGDSSLWNLYMPRRGDVGYDVTMEEGGYIRDPRFFEDYADVQGLGVKHDFCRMVQPMGGSYEDNFFACALAGTEGLSSVAFKTQSVKQGLQITRDDYMNMTSYKTIGYCRILKLDDFQDPFQAICTATTPSGFKSTSLDTQDAKPPEDIALKLQFFRGIIIWLRLIDDMVDYAQNLIIQGAGGIGVQETPPKPKIARTLQFDGASQFLKIGDSTDLTFGNAINLQYMRTVSFWVYFEEFTNNAHIFDFGNGAGRDNVFMGIIGRGNSNASMDPSELFGCKRFDTTIPDYPSGAQTVDETTPQHLMETTSANVNDFQCDKPEVYGETLPPVQPFTMPTFTPTSADLLYEVWDSQQRKLHIQIPSAFPLKKWTHVVLTTTNRDATRPTLVIYIDGVLTTTEEAAWLPQEKETTSNYIGKSNWSNATSSDSNPDEFFKGQLFDFRVYFIPMTPKLIKQTYEWGQICLGLKKPPETKTSP